LLPGAAWLTAMPVSLAQDYKPTQPSGGVTPPGVSIKGRWTEKGQHDDGLGDTPGPGAYTLQQHQLPRGKSPPKYTFGGGWVGGALQWRCCQL
jgi:hypothetical protein